MTYDHQPGPRPAPDAPVEYRCRRCGHVLGQECADRLRLGGAHVLGKVLLACAACGRRWVWSGPGWVWPAPVDNPPPARA